MARARLEQAHEFDIDTSRPAPRVVNLLAKQRKGPKISFQVLLYPLTDANLDDGSYKEFAERLTKKAMEWFWDAHLPDGKRNDL